MTPLIINIAETASTNTLLRDPAYADAPSGTVLNAVAQTAGRGQRGNSWEAAPGANLTFSLLYRPGHLTPQRQYAISRAVALAVADTVADALSCDVKVKWPNDIYVADRKIAGILIEHSISPERISRTIIGVGLNVNQRRFLSDAPNPVSMLQIAGREFPLPTLLERLSRAILDELSLIDVADYDAAAPAQRSRYRSRLWRGTGLHPYMDAATGVCFDASIEDVDDLGYLHLRHADGTLTRHPFKSVAFQL